MEKTKTVCEWCGSTDNLHRHHIKNKKSDIPTYKQFRFAVFREISPPLERPLTYKQIMAQRGCTYNEAGEIHRKMKAENSKKGKENWQTFLSDIGLQEKIKQEYERQYKPLIDRYKEFHPDDVIILCNRCHFAIHRGMDLCPKCKKKYKRTCYEVCFDCLPDDVKKQILDDADRDIEAEKEFFACDVLHEIGVLDECGPEFFMECGGSWVGVLRRYGFELGERIGRHRFKVEAHKK